MNEKIEKMAEKMCKYCMCSDEPDNTVLEINGVFICECCIRISADIAAEMGVFGKE